MSYSVDTCPLERMSNVLILSLVVFFVGCVVYVNLPTSDTSWLALAGSGIAFCCVGRLSYVLDRGEIGC